MRRAAADILIVIAVLCCLAGCSETEGNMGRVLLTSDAAEQPAVADEHTPPTVIFMKNLYIVLSRSMEDYPYTDFKDLHALAEALNDLSDEDSRESTYVEVEVNGYAVAASGEKGDLISVSCIVPDGLSSAESQILWQAAAGTATDEGKVSLTFIDQLEAAGETPSTLGPVSYGQWEFTASKDADGRWVLKGTACDPVPPTTLDQASSAT